MFERGICEPERPGSGLDRLAKHRALCLSQPGPAEAHQLGLLAAELRQVRAAASCSRARLAETLAVDVEVVVAVENGYGHLPASAELLRRARTALAAS